MINIDQANELRDTFRLAMIGWDVTVSVTIEHDYANVTFELWKTKFEGAFYLVGEGWITDFDCPHYIINSETVWQWISMQLHDKLNSLTQTTTNNP